MAIIVGQLITVSFLPVAWLILALPTRASEAHDRRDMLGADLQVGTPGMMIERLAGAVV